MRKKIEALDRSFFVFFTVFGNLLPYRSNIPNEIKRIFSWELNFSRKTHIHTYTLTLEKFPIISYNFISNERISRLLFFLCKALNNNSCSFSPKRLTKYHTVILILPCTQYDFRVIHFGALIAFIQRCNHESQINSVQYTNKVFFMRGGHKRQCEYRPTVLTTVLLFIWLNPKIYATR